MNHNTIPGSYHFSACVDGIEIWAQPLDVYRHQVQAECSRLASLFRAVVYAYPLLGGFSIAVADGSSFEPERTA